MRKLLLVLFAATALGAQETLNVTAIEVVAEVQDKSGNAPRGLTAADFVVLEDGVERTIVGVDYLAVPRTAAPVAVPQPATPEPAPAAEAKEAPWQFVVYFESELSSSAGRRQVAQAIAREAEYLVKIGTVDVIFASPTPVALIRNSRDPKAIGEALKKVMNHRGTNQLLTNRRQFRDWLLGGSSNLRWEDVRPYLQEDEQLVIRFRRNLRHWLSGYGKRTPRMAIVVTDGFDLDPAEYYVASFRAAAAKSEIRSVANDTSLGAITHGLAKELAAASWIVSSVPAQMDMGMQVDDATAWGLGRMAPGRPIGPKNLVDQPVAPMRALAEATGGTVIGNHSKFGDALDDLGRYVKLTYQVSRPPDNNVHKIEVRSRRADLKVRAQQWVATPNPKESEAELAISRLGDADRAGELPVDGVLKPGSIEGTAKLDVLSELIKIESRRAFRLTLAVLKLPTATVISKVGNVDVADGVFRYRLAMDLPDSASAVIVTVEDVETGAWGSVRVRP